jgi:hypothetical protein
VTSSDQQQQQQEAGKAGTAAARWVYGQKESQLHIICPCHIQSGIEGDEALRHLCPTLPGTVDSDSGAGGGGVSLVWERVSAALQVESKATGPPRVAMLLRLRSQPPECVGPEQALCFEHWPSMAVAFQRNQLPRRMVQPSRLLINHGQRAFVVFDRAGQSRLVSESMLRVWFVPVDGVTKLSLRPSAGRSPLWSQHAASFNGDWTVSRPWGTRAMERGINSLGLTLYTVKSEGGDAIDATSTSSAHLGVDESAGTADLPNESSHSFRLEKFCQQHCWAEGGGGNTTAPRQRQQQRSKTKTTKGGDGRNKAASQDPRKFRVEEELGELDLPASGSLAAEAAALFSDDDSSVEVENGAEEEEEEEEEEESCSCDCDECQMARTMALMDRQRTGGTLGDPTGLGSETIKIKATAAAGDLMHFQKQWTIPNPLSRLTRYDPATSKLDPLLIPNFEDLQMTIDMAIIQPEGVTRNDMFRVAIEQEQIRLEEARALLASGHACFKEAVRVVDLTSSRRLSAARREARISAVQPMERAREAIYSAGFLVCLAQATDERASLPVEGDGPSISAAEMLGRVAVIKKVFAQAAEVAEAEVGEMKARDAQREVLAAQAERELLAMLESEAQQQQLTKTKKQLKRERQKQKKQAAAAAADAQQQRQKKVEERSESGSRLEASHHGDPVQPEPEPEQQTESDDSGSEGSSEHDLEMIMRLAPPQATAAQPGNHHGGNRRSSHRHRISRQEVEHTEEEEGRTTTREPDRAGDSAQHRGGGGSGRCVASPAAALMAQGIAPPHWNARVACTFEAGAWPFAQPYRQVGEYAAAGWDSESPDLVRAMELVIQRQWHKKFRDFDAADESFDALQAMGVLVDDARNTWEVLRPGSARWRRQQSRMHERAARAKASKRAAAAAAAAAKTKAKAKEEAKEGEEEEEERERERHRILMQQRVRCREEERERERQAAAVRQASSPQRETAPWQSETSTPGTAGHCLGSITPLAGIDGSAPVSIPHTVAAAFSSLEGEEGFLFGGHAEAPAAGVVLAMPAAPAPPACAPGSSASSGAGTADCSRADSNGWTLTMTTLAPSAAEPLVSAAAFACTERTDEQAAQTANSAVATTQLSWQPTPMTPPTTAAWDAAAWDRACAPADRLGSGSVGAAGRGTAPAATPDRTRTASEDTSFEADPVMEAFLASQRLDKYTQIFRENELDFQTLLMCEDDDLKEMGVAKGPRVKIIRTMKEYDATRRLHYGSHE